MNAFAGLLCHIAVVVAEALGVCAAVIGLSFLAALLMWRPMVQPRLHIRRRFH